MREPQFTVDLARTEADVVAAQRLRYEVFVGELGGDGAMVDHVTRREIDRFDALADHLILRDLRRPPEDRVVGVYRVMLAEHAARAGRFYSEDEYDLAPILAGGRRPMELGRSCVHRDYRGGTAMHHLWAALGDYAMQAGIDLLFGVASFHGTDVDAIAAPLSILHHRHLAPEALRVRARPPHAVAMDILPDGGFDRAAAMRAVPPLIKAYLRLGGVVGEGAYVDHHFNTVDVCLLLDTARLDPRWRSPRPRPR